MAAAKVFAALRTMLVATVAADAFVLNWAAVPEAMRARWPRMVLLDDLVLLAPALVMMLTMMLCRHRFEARRMALSLSLPRYLALRFRVEMALVLVPWTALILVSDGTAALLHGSSAPLWVPDAVGGIMVALLLVLSPLIIRVIWRTSSLPAGPLRERLEAFCRAHRFRCNDILLWHTYGHLANAGVVGPTPLMRYVVLSDALVAQATPPEIEAVFAHEAGHVLLRHMQFYLFFAVAFVCFYANLMDLLALTGWILPLGDVLGAEMNAAQAVVMLLFAGLYWGIGFGMLSRRMEQQADLFSLNEVPEPAAFIAALEGLAVAERVPRRATFWRHFSIARRVEFLRSVLADPAAGVHFQRRLRALKAALVAWFTAGALRLLIARPEMFGM
jgi:STE24 endopeptidase